MSDLRDAVARSDLARVEVIVSEIVAERLRRDRKSRGVKVDAAVIADQLDRVERKLDRLIGESDE